MLPPIEKWTECALKSQVELVAFKQESEAMLSTISETALVKEYPERFTPLLLDDHVHIYLVQYESGE